MPKAPAQPTLNYLLTKLLVLNQDKPLLLLAGPTASGKSQFAIELAKWLNGEIINADASQFYADIPIISAAPEPQDQAIVPHHLFGVVKAGGGFSAQDFVILALPIIRDCWQNGRLPIVVGGSGFYFHALRYGLSNIPDIDPDIRQIVRDIQITTGAEGLYHALQAEDAPMAQKLPDNDQQRLARALEVIRSTGKSLLWWQNQPAQMPLPEACIFAALINPPREWLQQRIKQRLEAMVAKGAVVEAQALSQQNLPADAPVMKAIGVREFIRHADGLCSLAEALAAAHIATRRYAKRQQTWFRHQYLADWQWQGDAAKLIPAGLEECYQAAYGRFCKW